MTQLVCFDVDNTLANTAQLNRDAYHQVGVEMPDGAWGLPWQEWLIDLVGDQAGATLVHEIKTTLYEELLTQVTLEELSLSAAHVARELERHTEIRVTYLTAADTRTARRVLRKLELRGPVVGGLTYAQRSSILRETVGNVSELTYVDDNVTTVKQLARDLPTLRVVHYTGQSATVIARLVAPWAPGWYWGGARV